jgi:hypothetical protein
MIYTYVYPLLMVIEFHKAARKFRTALKENPPAVWPRGL